MPACVPTFLIVLAAVFDFFIAIAIPFFSSINIFVVGINFTNAADRTALFSGPSSNSSFNGFVNSVQVVNLINIELGLWAACFNEASPQGGGVGNSTCFSASFGYTVVVDDDNTRQAVNLVQNQWTFPLFIDLLAMGITMVSAFTQGRPRHNYVIAGAIALTMASAIVEFLLFNSVQKVAPVLGSQASLGPGFGLNVVAIFLLLFAVLATYVGST